MEKQETKKRSLREELVVAGVRFLETHSVRELTMRKIASLCNVTPHAIYNHYKSKDALIAAITQRVLDELSAYTIKVVMEPSGHFMDKFQHLISLYLFAYEKYPHYLESIHSNGRPPSFSMCIDDDRVVCEPQFPGWPSLKKLVEMQGVCFPRQGAPRLAPEAVIDYVAKNRPFSEGGADCELSANLDQLLMLAIVNGFPNMARENLASGEWDREDFLRHMLGYLFKRMLQ